MPRGVRVRMLVDKTKMRQDFLLDDEPREVGYFAGEIYNVPVMLGRRWLKEGWCVAEPIEQKQKKSKPPK